MKRKGILAGVLCVCTSGLCAQGRVSGNLLEELMEKLPGKVIVEDGTVKINGKQVERIIVDGKDTLSFFNQRICNDSTKHQGKMENLLKKLPGVQVQPDGTVRIHGKDVKRILIDGKEISVPCNKERQINDISYLSVKAGTGENEGAN